MQTDLNHAKGAKQGKAMGHDASGDPPGRRGLGLGRRDGTVRALDRLAGADAVEAFVERSVHQITRAYDGVRVELASVPMSRVRPLARQVRAQRLEKSSRYLMLLQRAGLEPFVPTALQFRGESTFRVALPPVVERHGDALAVVDGMHRLGVAVEAGLNRVVCIVVTADHLPGLPGDLGRWREVHVRETSDQYRSRKSKFVGWRRSAFRPAGQYLRSEYFEFDSLGEIATACAQAKDRRSEPLTQYWCQRHQRLDDC